MDEERNNATPSRDANPSPKTNTSPNPNPPPNPAQLIPTLSYGDALALAESRGHTIGQNHNDLLHSEYLTIEEKAAMLRTVLDEQYEINRQTMSEDQFNSEKAYLADFELLYDFLVEYADRTDHIYDSTGEIHNYIAKTLPGSGRLVYERLLEMNDTGDTRSMLFERILECVLYEPYRTTFGTQVGTGATVQNPPSTQPSSNPQTISNTDELKKAMENAGKGYDASIEAYEPNPSAATSIQSRTRLPYSSDPPLGKYEGYWVWGNMVNGVPDGLCNMVRGRSNKTTITLNEMAMWGSGEHYDPRDTINGYLKDGKLNGIGVMNNPYFNYYGEFQDGEFHGSGELTVYDADSKTETRWIGQWKNGKFTGYGRIRFNYAMFSTDYIEFSGYFENGLMTSSGSTYLRSTDTTYYGTFDKDFNLVDLYGVYEMTEQEKASREASLAMIYNLMKSASSSYNPLDTITASQERLNNFRTRLAASQPPMRYRVVPSYGMAWVPGRTDDVRGVGIGWESGH